MSRFFVSPDAFSGNKINISGEEAHHILDVMRLKKLDKVVAFDGTGVEYVGFIREIKSKSLVVEVVETRKPASLDRSKITLIQAIPKKDKMDLIVEKATELGVFSILPVFSERSVPRWDERKREERRSRWEKVAKQAAKQCGRADLPDIRKVADFKSVADRAVDYDLCLIAALNENSEKLRSAISGFRGGKVAIAIGPEGDFTANEIESARGSGFKLVDLGPLVLKSDTAGIAVLAILNYEFRNS